MSLDKASELVAAFSTISIVLFALWMQSGLAAALVAAALTDLGLTLIEWHRARDTGLIRVRRKD